MCTYIDNVLHTRYQFIHFASITQIQLLFQRIAIPPLETGSAIFVLAWLLWTTMIKGYHLIPIQLTENTRIHHCCIISIRYIIIRIKYGVASLQHPVKYPQFLALPIG